MGRHRRTHDEPCCYHITHRCQERRFLLRFERDRQRYVTRLREMTLAHPVQVLDYIVTANHVHLLLWAEKARYISTAMGWLQGNTARDYNRRKHREGSFWRGRYHPTMIETGSHLSRCLFYIDLNMVRAGVCGHPREWRAAGYHELCGARRRYRIIRMSRLLAVLGLAMPGGESAFRRWYTATMEEMLVGGHAVREPVWSEAVAVGSRAWLERLGPGIRGATMEPLAPVAATGHVAEDAGSYVLQAPSRARMDFWRRAQTRP